MRRRALAAQSGITLLVCRRVGLGTARGLELTKPWTNMALGYVSYDVYTRKFTRKRRFARAATSTRPAAAAYES